MFLIRIEIVITLQTLTGSHLSWGVSITGIIISIFMMYRGKNIPTTSSSESEMCQLKCTQK